MNIGYHKPIKLPTELLAAANCPPEIYGKYKVFVPPLYTSAFGTSDGVPSKLKSVVYLAERKLGRKHVAIKMYAADWVLRHKARVENEIEAAKILGDPITSIGPEVYDVIVCKSGAIAVVMELCNGGSFELYSGRQPDSVTQEIAVFLVYALRTMNLNNLSCRYIMPRHVLIKVDQKLIAEYKLVGCVQMNEVENVNDPAIVPFVAPEVRVPGVHTAEADVWSLGVFLYQLGTGRRINDLNSLYVSSALANKLRFPEDVKLNPDLLELIHSCICSKTKRAAPGLLAKQRYVALTLTGSVLNEPLFDLLEERPSQLCATTSVLEPTTSPSLVPSEEAKKPPHQVDIKAFAVQLTGEKHIAIVNRPDLGSLAVTEDTVVGDKTLFKTLDMASPELRMVRRIPFTTISVLQAVAVVNEIRFLSWLKGSPYFVNLEESIVVGEELYLVMKWCNGGTLEEFVNSHFKAQKAENFSYLHPQVLSLITWSIACALKKLVKLGVQSFSMSPGNILLVEDKKAQKITAAKLACIFDYSATQTLAASMEKQSGKEGLVRAFGRLMYFVLFGSYPSPIEDVLANESSRALMEKLRRMADYVEYVGLMEKCLNLEPTKRPNVDALLNDRFFNTAGQVAEGFVNVPAAASCELFAKAITYHKCIKIKNKKSFLMKKVDLSKLKGQQVRIRNELITTSMLRNCKNVIKLYEYFMYDKDNLCIITKFYDTNLEAFVKARAAKNPLSNEEKVRIVRDVVTAIADMHSHNIVHRGIRPESVMVIVDGDGKFRKAKVGGFVVARKLQEEEECKSFYQAEKLLDYTPPEMKRPSREKRLDHRCDVWSLGMLIYFILYGIHIQQENKEYSRIDKGDIKAPRAEIDQDLRTMMESCLKTSPKDRPRSDKLLGDVHDILAATGAKLECR